MAGHFSLEQIAIVLNAPRYSENIGAAARAMLNMGFSKLEVVAPHNFDLKKARKLATHEAVHIVEQARFHDSLQTALGAYNYVVGTTARTGGQRPRLHSPGNFARWLVPFVKENRVAIVFGPEDCGLTNEEIRLCHALINIPTARFASLNLAQAVMIICYEISKAGAKAPVSFKPRLATRHELDGMYAQLREVLVKISYINVENPDYWMNKLRHFGSRLELRAREVSIIRGICRQVNWFGEKRFRDGISALGQGGAPKDASACAPHKD